MRVQPIESPHTYSWIQDSMMSRNVIEYLTQTGGDNITRPWLCEKWEASDDLKTWTLHLHKDIKWSNGDPFTADHVIWNINHCLDPATGSSVLGLMKGYMLTEFDTGEKDENGAAKMSTKLWDANAIEKVDDHTVRLNAQVPQLAVPEHFFHYPFAIMHPSSEGKFPGVGSIGTGWAEMTEYELGKKCVVTKKRRLLGRRRRTRQRRVHRSWRRSGGGARRHCLEAGRRHLGSATPRRSPRVQKLANIQLYQVNDRRRPASPACSRPTTPGRTHASARRCGWASTTEKVLQVAYLGLGVPAEHHHVAPVHPEYYKLPFMKQDIEAREEAAGRSRRSRRLRGGTGLHQGSGLGVQGLQRDGRAVEGRSASTSR